VTSISKLADRGSSTGNSANAARPLAKSQNPEFIEEDDADPSTGLATRENHFKSRISCTMRGKVSPYARRFIN
jgi:hypothetical protein